jgi:flagellar motor protein MotB
VVTDNGTIDKQPVPTNYTLPDNRNQSFINIIFENSQLEEKKIFSNNTFGEISGNITEGMENRSQ